MALSALSRIRLIALGIVGLLILLGVLDAPPPESPSHRWWLHWGLIAVISAIVATLGQWISQCFLSARATQGRFESIAQATNDALWDYDIRHNSLWWSGGYRELFRTDPPPHIAEWYEAIHPEDRARVETRFRNVLEGTALSWDDAYRYRRADGSYAHIVDRALILRDAQRRALRMIGGMRDVTEQTLARQELRQMNEQLRSVASQYRAVIDQSLAGIMVLQDGCFRYVNPKLAEMTGYQTRELLAMPSAPDCLVEEDRQAVAEIIHRRLHGDVSGGPTRLRWKRPDGSILWAEVHGSRIEYLGAPAIMGVAVDITERLRSEATQRELFDQLLGARERLQALSGQLLHVQEEERRHLARDLHDEIGQSLTVLKMNLQAFSGVPGLLHSPVGAEAHVDSQRVLDSLIAHVRNLSLDLRPAMLDDLGLPETLRWFVQRQASRGGWAAKLEVDDDLANLPSTIALPCFRIVQECLTNTMRHAGATQVTVCLNKDESGVHLLVEDNGQGFDVGAAMSRGAQGGSVGLLSMHERVRALRGVIQVESAVGSGTRVRVTLPVGDRA